MRIAMATVLLLLALRARARERATESKGERECVGMRSSRLTLPLDTVMHGQASGNTRCMVFELVGHDRHSSGWFEKAVRPTKMALFTNLYLLIHGEFLKTSVIQSVELCEYYNFAIMIMA